MAPDGVSLCVTDSRMKFCFFFLFFFFLVVGFGATILEKLPACVCLFGWRVDARTPHSITNGANELPSLIKSSGEVAQESDDRIMHERLNLSQRTGNGGRARRQVSGTDEKSYERKTRSGNSAKQGTA